MKSPDGSNSGMAFNENENPFITGSHSAGADSSIPVTSVTKIVLMDYDAWFKGRVALVVGKTGVASKRGADVTTNRDR